MTKFHNVRKKSLKVLTKKKKRLQEALKKEELRKLEESNRSAWDTYGSELCAGDMSAKEKRLQDEIDLLEDNGENLNVV